MKRALAVALVATAAGTASACIYFNAFYNAERQFDEARRAEARGEAEAAREAYRTAIDKAAKALRRDPDGSWADDALYLIGRSHFRLGDDRAAAAALERALRTTQDSVVRVGIDAYLGAARTRLADHTAALRHLDRAFAERAVAPDVAAFARLWRARARFGAGRDSAAWSDLMATAVADADEIAGEARFEWLRQAVIADDPGRAVAAAAALLTDPEADRWADSMLVWVDRAARRWGAARARDLLAAAESAAWSAATRARLQLRRAELTAEAGEIDRAVDQAREVASRASGRTADRARVLWARWELGRARSPDDLDDVREILLPVIDDGEAERLAGSLGVASSLVARAESGESPLAWFAAAELARDRLDAPTLARTFFVRYADAAPDSLWAPKALLAAAALSDSPAEARRLRERIQDRYRWTVYVDAIQGTALPDAFADAERRLQTALTTLSDRARQRAEERRAVALARADVVADSTLSTPAGDGGDSIHIACGRMVDSLAVRGARADSLRAACVRRDSVRVRSLIAPDSLPLDAVRADTTPSRPSKVRSP